MWSNAVALFDFGANALKCNFHLSGGHLFVVFLQEIIEVWYIVCREFAQWAQRRCKCRHPAESGRTSAKKAAPRRIACSVGARRAWSVIDSYIIHGVALSSAP